MLLRVSALIALMGIPVLAGASTGPSIPFATVRPIFSGDRYKSVVSIEIAGESTSGLVVLGPGLVYGTEPVMDPIGETGLRLFVRAEDGSWRVLQTISVSENALDPVVFDLDGDGLQDIAIPSISQRNLSSIHYLRQDAGGRLMSPSSIALPESVIVTQVVRANADDHMIALGRVILTNCIWAAELEWTPSTGLRILWERRYCREDLGSLRSFTWLPWGASGLALVSAEVWGEWDSYYTLRLDDGVWLESTTIPPRDARIGTFSTDRRTGIRRWMWGMLDSIYRLDPDGEGRIVARAIPIRGFPEGWRGDFGGIPSRVSVIGDPPIIAKAGAMANSPEIGFVELADDSTANWIGRWEHAPVYSYIAPMVAVVSRGDRSVLTIHEVAGAICEFEGPGTQPPVDVPLTLLARVYEDLTGDGIPDLFGLTPGDSGMTPCFARGIPEPPWFLPPEPVDVDRHLADTAVDDFDGDGMPDLVLCVSSNSSDVLVPLSYDGVTLAPWDGDPVQIDGGDILAGDFDGNGRPDILTMIRWQALEHTILSWGRDRRVASPLPMNGLIWNPVACVDFDADGRPEILNWRYGDLQVQRCNLDNSTIEVVWNVNSNMTTLWDVATGSFDAGRSVQLVWSDAKNVEICSSEGPGSPPRMKQIEGLLRVGHDSLLGSADLDANGLPEILASDEGILSTVWDPVGSAHEEVRILPEALAGVRSCRPVIADVDHDGDADLVVFRSDGIRVERNNTIETTRTTGGPLQIRLLNANPSRGPISAALRSTSGRSEAKIQLLDVSGRRLWQTNRAVDSEGWTRIDIPAERMRSLPAGIYWLRAETAAAQSSVVKIIRLR